MTLDLSVLEGDSALQPARSGQGEGVPSRAALALFEEDPDNPRFEESAPEFELLVADVRMHGILQPIVVCCRENGRLRIRFGARRYRAAIAAGLAEAPYVVTEDPRHLDDYAQVAENERRAPLQPLELATFAARKIAAGERKAVVAGRLGMHPSALTHLLCLAGNPPPFLLELYHSGRCRAPAVMYRLLRLWRQIPAEVETACALAKTINGSLVESIEAGVRSVRFTAVTCDPLEVSDVRPAPATVKQPTDASDDVANAGGYIDKGKAHRIRLKHPRLNGKWKDREVVLMFRMKPPGSQLVIVLDVVAKVELVVPISEIILTSLVCE